VIFLFIGLPLIVAALLPLIGRLSKKLLPDVLGNGVFLVLLLYALTGARSLVSAGPVVQSLDWFGETVALKVAVDGFSLLMLAVISLVSLCVGLYSIDYMEHYGSKANYYALLLMMVAGMNGLVLVTDLF
jgi:multicomponent Na+:H+ antiporter subunit D